jgi:uncharacterized membrane protein
VREGTVPYICQTTIFLFIITLSIIFIKHCGICVAALGTVCTCQWQNTVIFCFHRKLIQFFGKNWCLLFLSLGGWPVDLS